jgi:hypothetical protein
LPLPTAPRYCLLQHNGDQSGGLGSRVQEICLHPDLEALLNHQIGFVRSLHAASSLAPVGATMRSSGEIEGAALIMSDAAPDANTITDDDAVSLLSRDMIAAAARGEIRASAIFCHLVNANHPAVQDAPAGDDPDVNCIVALLDHRDGQAVAACFDYVRDEAGAWAYAAPQFFDKKPVIFAARA